MNGWHILRRTLVAALGLCLVSVAAARDGSPRDPAGAALRTGGTVALIRHATAPGTGDPANFRLGDCSTQRNLSDAGRRQAAELGGRMRAAGVLVTEVRASRWCRAQDTAALAFPNVPTRPDAALDSFFADSATGPSQTAQARRTIAEWQGRQGALAIVTHQVNITALTGVFPSEGEIVVVAPRVGGFDVVGRTRM